MENVLRDLFDFQRFAKNPKLGRVIDAAHEDMRLTEISDDMLDAAAGGRLLTEEEEKKKKHDLL